MPVNDLSLGIFKTATVVKIMDPFDCDFSFKTKWVASLVDLSDYRHTLEQEQLARQLINKSKAKKAMAEALEEIHEKLSSEDQKELEGIVLKIVE